MSSYSIIAYQAPLLPKTYEALIYSKWLRSLKYGNEYFKLIESQAYFSAYHTYIHNIITRPDTEIRLAVLTEDPDVVLGFSVHRGPVLEYIHVHKDMRHQGIGTSLFPDGITTITHLTNIGTSIWANKYPHLSFNPFVQ
jgi:GNAT superfamily N-acetyltransferase